MLNAEEMTGVIIAILVIYITMALLCGAWVYLVRSSSRRKRIPSLLEKKANHSGMTVYDPDAGGDSMFAAVVDQLRIRNPKSNVTASSLRLSAVEHLRRHPQIVDQIPWLPYSSSNLEQYLLRMSRNGIHGDNAMLYVLADHCQRRILVYRDDMNPPYVINPTVALPWNSIDQLYLGLYEQSSYVSLRPLGIEEGTARDSPEETGIETDANISDSETESAAGDTAGSDVEANEPSDTDNDFEIVNVAFGDQTVDIRGSMCRSVRNISIGSNVRQIVHLITEVSPDAIYIINDMIQQRIPDSGTTVGSKITIRLSNPNPDQLDRFERDLIQGIQINLEDINRHVGLHGLEIARVTGGCILIEYKVPSWKRVALFADDFYTGKFAEFLIFLLNHPKLKVDYEDMLNGAEINVILTVSREERGHFQKINDGLTKQEKTSIDKHAGPRHEQIETSVVPVTKECDRNPRGYADSNPTQYADRGIYLTLKRSTSTNDRTESSPSENIKDPVQMVMKVAEEVVGLVFKHVESKENVEVVEVEVSMEKEGIPRVESSELLAQNVELTRFCRKRKKQLKQIKGRKWIQKMEDLKRGLNEVIILSKLATQTLKRLEEEALNQVRRCVGIIYANRKPIGTGFLIGNRYILTAGHVIWAAKSLPSATEHCELMLNLYGQKEKHPCLVVYNNMELDVAILKIGSEDLQSDIALKQITNVSPGDPFYLVGHPLGKREQEVERSVFQSRTGDLKSIPKPYVLFQSPNFFDGSSGSPCIVRRHSRVYVGAMLVGGIVQTDNSNRSNLLQCAVRMTDLFRELKYTNKQLYHGILDQSRNVGA